MSVQFVFDRAQLRARQRRARARGAATFLLDHVAAELSERLAAVLRTFSVAVDLGTPTDAVRRARAASGKIDTLIAAEPAAAVLDDDFLRVAADEETLPFADGSLDMVVSALALHWVNDLPGALIQIRRALRPDGLLLAAMLGGDTLIELREAFASAESEIVGGLSPRVAPFADLRAMGATNALNERRRAPRKRATLLRMAEIYAARCADADGRVRATFEIAWLSGWSPHESQQKPLKPGSASKRLADALGVKEIAAGDKARG